MNEKTTPTSSEQPSQKATDASQPKKRSYPTKEEYLAGIKKVKPVVIRGYKPIL